MLGLKDAIIIAGRRYMMPFIDKKYSITHRSYHQPGTDSRFAAKKGHAAKEGVLIEFLCLV